MSETPRILVFGRTGQLARALKLHGAGRAHLEFLGREEADFAQPGEASRAAERADADLAVIAAAYTAVDRAESEEALAMRVNAEAPGEIAAACAGRGVPLIYVSTDYVFPGGGDAPWREDDAAAPVNAYGRSKAAGERAVLDVHPGALVLRTSWVFSPWGPNFVTTMLRLARERDTVSVVSDQNGRPTGALDLARAILDLAPALIDGRARGALHFANAGATNWADFAEAIFAGAAARGLPAATVARIATADYPAQAQRPSNSVLDTTRLEREFGIAPRPWGAALDETLDRIEGGEAAP